MWYDIDAIKKERKTKTPKGGESSEPGRRVAADVRKITRVRAKPNGGFQAPDPVGIFEFPEHMQCGQGRTIE